MNRSTYIQIFFIKILILYSTTVYAEIHGQQTSKGVIFGVKKLLGPYPAPGSIEEKRDFDELIYWQKTRTNEQCEQAKREEKVSLKTLFGGADGPLTTKEVKRLKYFFYWHGIRAGIPTKIAKKRFKRPRPYDRNPEITPCIKKEKSYAYPSGHTTVSRVMAHVLSKKFPERKDLFMERADQIAQNRIIGGVHHPSDIVSGKKLADAISKKLLNSKKFLQKLNRL